MGVQIHSGRLDYRIIILLRCSFKTCGLLPTSSSSRGQMSLVYYEVYLIIYSRISHSSDFTVYSISNGHPLSRDCFLGHLTFWDIWHIYWLNHVVLDHWCNQIQAPLVTAYLNIIAWLEWEETHILLLLISLNYAQVHANFLCMRVLSVFKLDDKRVNAFHSRWLTRDKVSHSCCQDLVFKLYQSQICWNFSSLFIFAISWIQTYFSLY